MSDDLKYFVLLDDAGNPQGFYPSDVWPTAPVGSIEITKAQWRQFLDREAAGQRYQFINGELVAAVPPPTVVESAPAPAAFE